MFFFFIDFISGWSSLVPRPPFLAALVWRHSWLNSCSSCTISQWTESYSNGKYRYLSRVFFRQLASVPCLTSFGFERSFNLFCLQWNLYYTHWTLLSAWNRKGSRCKNGYDLVKINKRDGIGDGTARMFPFSRICMTPLLQSSENQIVVVGIYKPQCSFSVCCMDGLRSSVWDSNNLISSLDRKRIRGLFSLDHDGLRFRLWPTLSLVKTSPALTENMRKKKLKTHRAPILLTWGPLNKGFTLYKET